MDTALRNTANLQRIEQFQKRIERQVAVVRLADHKPTGVTYTPSSDEYKGWCDKCGKEIYGSEIYDDDRGWIFCGWFHKAITDKGTIYGSTKCPN